MTIDYVFPATAEGVQAYLFATVDHDIHQMQIAVGKEIVARDKAAPVIDALLDVRSAAAGIRSLRKRQKTGTAA